MRVHFSQSFQGIVQGNNIDIEGLGLFFGLVQSQLADVAAALGGPMTAGVVDQDLAHQLRRDGKEMGAVLPLRQILRDHAHVSFMNQSCALQRVFGAFALKVMLGNATQLVVNEGHQRIESFSISAAPSHQQLCDLTGRGLRHLNSPRRAGGARSGAKHILLSGLSQVNETMALRTFFSPGRQTLQTAELIRTPVFAFQTRGHSAGRDGQDVWPAGSRRQAEMAVTVAECLFSMLERKEWTMPTRVSYRLCWIITLLTVSMAAQAEDLHIKKSITVGGNFVSATETSIKGARERTVSQSPTGNTITLRQCDLKRTITINDQAQTYFVANDPQDDAAIKAAAMVSGAPAANDAAYITETSTVTDTGERKTMYGFPARHLKGKVTVQSSANACSQLNQNYEVDGWYTDISKEQTSSCGEFLPPIRETEGCNDRVIRRRSGSGKPGYPLTETLTLHNAEGTTTQIGVLISDLSRQTLEKELFEIPAGYREVKSLAELNGAAQPSAAPAAAYVPPAPANAPKGPSMAQMMNPATQLAMQQQMMAQAQQMGMGGAMNQGGMPGMGGVPQPGGGSVAAPQALGPKAPGRIRVGVAPPDAQLGQGNNAGADYSTPIRNAQIMLMSGPAVEIAALDSHIAMQLQAEAQQKQCDYILYSAVTVKHSQGGGFGKFMKMGGMAASMTPMGSMAHGMGGAVAAQAAGMAASQMAQQQAMSQLAGFNGQIKSKDNVTIQYQLAAAGQTAPVLQNSLEGKAKSDGEDVLTPLLQQVATTVLAEVSKNKK